MKCCAAFVILRVHVDQSLTDHIMGSFDVVSLRGQVETVDSCIETTGHISTHTNEKKEHIKIT